MKNLIHLLFFTALSANIFGQTQEDVSRNDFGGVISIGFALGGGGLIGAPIRIYPVRQFAIEAGVYYRPFILIKETSSYFGTERSTTVYHQPMLAGGFIFYPGVSHQTDQVRLNGLSLKTGHSFGDLPETLASIGWAAEKIKGRNLSRSFSVEVGAGITILHDNPYADEYSLTKTNIGPLIYWKLHWGWFVT